MIWAWITEGDGFVILLSMWLICVTIFNILYVKRSNTRLNLCEFRIQGFSEKIMAANDRATQVGHELRRVTGSFDKIVDEELASAATRIRNRVAPEDES